MNEGSGVGVRSDVRGAGRSQVTLGLEGQVKQFKFCSGLMGIHLTAYARDAKLRPLFI